MFCSKTFLLRWESTHTLCLKVLLSSSPLRNLAKLMRERLDDAAALPGWIHVPLKARRGESDSARGERPGGKKGSSLPMDSLLAVDVTVWAGLSSAKRCAFGNDQEINWRNE